MRLSCEARLQLRAGSYSASVAPGAGGRVTSLAWHGRSLAVPLLLECEEQQFDEHAWPKAGAFPMLPFTNRLPAEGLRVGARILRPASGPGGFPIHGFAHRRRWDVADHRPHRVLMRCEHKGASDGWPWPWSAELEVELDAEGMLVTLRVRNDAQEAMPVALGWHPYHRVAKNIAWCELQFAADARHDLDAQGQAMTAAHAAQFTMERGETAAFSGWTGTARILHPGHGTIIVACDATRHVVVHRPAQGDYLCIEPVSLLPGQLGAVLLPPGETQRLTWSCAYEPVDPAE